MHTASLSLLRAVTPLLRLMRAAMRPAGPGTTAQPGAYGVLAQEQHRHR